MFPVTGSDCVEFVEIHAMVPIGHLFSSIINRMDSYTNSLKKKTIIALKGTGCVCVLDRWQRAAC